MEEMLDICLPHWNNSQYSLTQFNGKWTRASATADYGERIIMVRRPHENDCLSHYKVSHLDKQRCQHKFRVLQEWTINKRYNGYQLQSQDELLHEHYSFKILLGFSRKKDQISTRILQEMFPYGMNLLLMQVDLSNARSTS